MSSFFDFPFHDSIQNNLKKMNFDTPTPIQAASIGPALEGKDILGSAQTGTGKTAAFGLPLAQFLVNEPEGIAMVMTPTRELAAQVLSQLKLFLGFQDGIYSALLIGGEPMPKQFRQLDRKPRLIVGTPGRIYDHLGRRSLDISDTRFLVLDETDRMLDIGFTEQIQNIQKYMKAKRQTLLFSATLPKSIINVASSYLKDPVRISMNEEKAPAANIQQQVIKTDEGDKYNQLLEQIEGREGSIIVFLKTRHATEKMARRLNKVGHRSDAIHGDLRQNRRDKVIANFRKKTYRILVATDVAARGLDIPHIEHVINYDLPQNAEDYIHRIGRTARAGAEGKALNLVTPEDGRKWMAIERLLNPEKFANKKEGFRGGFKRKNSKPFSRRKPRARRA